MSKFVTALLALMLALPTFAAFQYDTVSSSSKNTTATAIVTTSPLQNTLHFNREAMVTFSMVKAPNTTSAVTFGMYTIDSNNQIGSEYKALAMQDGSFVFRDPVSGDIAKSGQGENGGFWGEADGVKKYSTPGINGVNGTYVGQQVAADGSWLVGFSMDNYFGPNDLANADYVFKVSVGEPLPGVVATLLLGGAGLGAFGLKRKKERQL